MRNPKDAKEWTDENVSKNKAPEQNSQSCFFDRSFCTPNQACWPTEAQWSSFNSTVNGKLIKVVPWANPCFTQPNSYKPKECAAIEKGESRKTRFNKEVDPLSFLMRRRRLLPHTVHLSSPSLLSILGWCIQS